MPSFARASQNRNRPSRERAEEYTAKHAHAPASATGPVGADAIYGLQSTMGNAFVANVAQGGVPTAPSAIPAAPEADEDEWTSSSSDQEYGPPAPDDDYGSQFSSGGGGGNEMSYEDTPGSEGPSSGGGGGSSAGSQWSSGSYGEEEVEANPQGLEKEEESSGWWPFDDDSEEEKEEEEEEPGGGKSWWDEVFGDDDEEPGQEEEPEEEEEKDPEEEEETNDTVVTENEEYENGGGGSMVVSPIATVASSTSTGGGSFENGSRTATVPFHSIYQCNYGAMYHSGHSHGGYPTAWVDGGRSGSVAWAGGGGAGPKGNEASGSYTADPPVYAARGNWWNKADAWVDSGGNVDVKRSYVASNSGDQGNGWWVTPMAAARLEQHEQKHVSTAGGNYTAIIDPMLGRVGASATTGKGKMFWKSDAIALLKRNIAWESSLKKFEETDKQDNGQGGGVDQVDMFGGNWPRKLGAQEIAGKIYSNVLVMNEENDPGKPIPNQGPSLPPPGP